MVPRVYMGGFSRHILYKTGKIEISIHKITKVYFNDIEVYSYFRSEYFNDKFI